MEMFESITNILSLLFGGSVISIVTWRFARRKAYAEAKQAEAEARKAEAEAKWGRTDAYRAYTEQTKDYSQQKQKDLADGMDRIMAEFAACRKNGKTPASAEAQSIVKTLQDYITGNYYPCTNEILAGLGQMYVADERFQTNIDKHADGTAAFICDAIKVYSSR